MQRVDAELESKKSGWNLSTNFSWVHIFPDTKLMLKSDGKCLWCYRIESESILPLLSVNWISNDSDSSILVKSFFPLPNQRGLICATDRGDLTFCNLSNPESATIKQLHLDAPATSFVMLDANILATGHTDGQLRIWNISNMKDPKCTKTLKVADTSVAVTKYKDSLICSSSQGILICELKPMHVLPPSPQSSGFFKRLFRSDTQKKMTEELKSPKIKR